VQSTGRLTHDDAVHPDEEGAAVRRRPPSGRPWLRFAGHYLEMVVAMVAGMVVLGGAWHALLALTGIGSLPPSPYRATAEMAVTMTVGMGAWMRVRGHAWPATVEMGAAMLVPAAAVIGLLGLGALTAGAAMVVEHAAMFVLMLVVMLRRRAEYTAVAHAGTKLDHWLATAVRSRPVRVLGIGLAVLLAFAVLPAGVFLAGSIGYEADRYTQPPVTAQSVAALAAATPPVHDPGKPTAVVLVGNSGANVSDALVPYDVLSATGAFNVYVVAPERRPVPLLGGLDVIPDLSLAQLDQRLGGAAPDVTVVPEMPAEAASDQAVTGWLRDTASTRLVVGVCTGARLVADAGLLTGRPATSHWYRLAGLEQAHPEVRWQRGTRYVDDGNVITTGGLLSSVDGALRAVERLAGPRAAADAAQAVGWRYYSPGKAAPLPGSRLEPVDAITHLLNLGYRASTTTLGVVLDDGVDELELAAAFDPYAEVKAARTVAVGAGGQAIHSRHGLTFVPRAGLDTDTVGQLDRLLVPGAAAAARPDPAVADLARSGDVPVSYLHEEPGFAFDGALREMAGATDLPTARWTAKILQYSGAELDLRGPTWPWQLMLYPTALGLAGVAVAVGLVGLARRVRARRA
jgi:putative intracellular protease/amidase